MSGLKDILFPGYHFEERSIEEFERQKDKRQCGDCSLCCKLMSNMALRSGFNRWDWRRLDHREITPEQRERWDRDGTLDLASAENSMADAIFRLHASRALDQGAQESRAKDSLIAATTRWHKAREKMLGARSSR